MDTLNELEHDSLEESPPPAIAEELPEQGPQDARTAHRERMREQLPKREVHTETHEQMMKRRYQLVDYELGRVKAVGDDWLREDNPAIWNAAL